MFLISICIMFLQLVIDVYILEPFLTASLFLESPQIAKFQSYAIQSNGSTFLLTCHVIQVVNDDNLKFEWFKNGNQINTDLIDPLRFQVDTKAIFSIFTLSQIEPSDSANYTCVVSSANGFDSQSTFLQVKGKAFY